jgi:CHRD domain-containing protein
MRVTRVFTALAAVTVLGIACGDDATGIPAGLEVFTANLNGANELPSAVNTTATGHAVVTILGDSLISWEVIIDSPIDSLTLGHIHRFNRDTGFGGVVVNFAPPARGLDFTGTATIGSATPVDSIFDIIRDGRAYVNIHTRANGGGEIRGNLVRQ